MHRSLRPIPALAIVPALADEVSIESRIAIAKGVGSRRESRRVRSA
jgi:hypothetical protein